VHQSPALEADVIRPFCGSLVRKLLYQIRQSYVLAIADMHLWRRQACCTAIYTIRQELN